MNPNETPETGAEVNQSEAKVHCSAWLEGDIALYIVKTERHEPKEQGARVIENEYRVLARSVIEAADIVAKSCVGVEETVRSSTYASHITKLPENKYAAVAL